MIRNGEKFFMKNLYYQDEKSLQAIDELLSIVNETLTKEEIILIGEGNSSSLVVGNFIGGATRDLLIKGGVWGTFNNELYTSRTPVKLTLWHKIKGFFKNVFTSKNKKENELLQENALLQKKYMRLTKVVEKQNALFEKYTKENSKLQKAYESNMQEIESLKYKIREYELLLEALKEAYVKLQNDIEQMVS